MSNWTTFAIDQLSKGETTKIKPHGNSMLPLVKSGALVTLAPAKKEDLKVNDIVLVKVHGSVYLHLIKAVQGDRYQIGNNKGRINGWANINAVFGKAVKIENP